VSHNILNVKYSNASDSNKDKSQEGAERFQQKVTSVAKKSVSVVRDVSRQHSLNMAAAMYSKRTAKGGAPTVTDASGPQAKGARDFQSAASTEACDDGFKGKDLILSGYRQNAHS
jgi:hypothetical protein